MKGNFEQYKPPERRYSDVVGVQQGVVDTSSATSLSALAGGVSSIGTDGIQLYSAFKKAEDEAKALEIEQQAEAARERQKAAFGEDLLAASLMAEQHGSQSHGFKAFLHQAYKYSDLDFETKTKMLKEFQSSILGKAFTEVSPEEEARNANIQEAVKANWVPRGATPEEVDRATDAYMANKRALQTIADKKAIAEARITDLNLTQREREEAKFESIQLQKEALLNLSTYGRHTQKNVITDIVRQFQDGKISSSEAKTAIKQSKSDLNASIATLSRDITNREYVKMLSDPLLEMFDIAEARVDSPTLLQDIEDQASLIIAKEKLSLLNDDKTAQTVAASSLYGHAPAVQALVSEDASRIATKMLATNSNKESPRGADLVVDTDEGRQAAKAYLDDVKYALSNAGKVDYKGDLLFSPEEIDTHIGNILKGATRFVNEDDSPKALQPLLEFLASPEFSAYAFDGGKIPADAKQNLLSTFESNAINKLHPAVRTALDSVLIPEATPERTVKSGRSTLKVGGAEDRKQTTGRRSGRSLITSKVGIDELDVQVIGNEVRFVGLNRDASAAAKQLNEQVGLTLSTYVKALANTTGESIEDALESQMIHFWPKDLFEEGQQYLDEKGRKFTWTNGKKVYE